MKFCRGQPNVILRRRPSSHRLLVNALLGISLKIVSTIAFTVMATMIKLAGSGYPTGQIVFFRSFFALMPLLVWLASRGELIDAVRTKRPLGHLRRSVAGSMAMFCGFTALALLPLPDATAIGYATPLITTALAAIVLKETVRVYRWSALGVGFLGMIVMMLPYFQAGGVGLTGGKAAGAMFGLLGAFCSAIASIETRRLAQLEKTGAIVFYFSTTAAVIGASTLVLGWRMPDGHDAAILMLAGVMGGIGQILLTSSYRFAPASVIAPFDYTTLVWALVVGVLVFSDIPEPLVVFGAGLVVAAGLFVIWRERRLGLENRKRERETGAQRAT
jgi:drug/metabolite transporter (DMT)-like permease